MRRIFLVVAALLLFTSCAGMSKAEREKIYGKAVPVITASFASERITQGEHWLVYLNASDPDGDMDSIVCVIKQSTADPYTPQWVKVPDDQRKDLSGYIRLDTEGPRGAVTLKMLVYVVDKAGHRSKPASYYLSFNSYEKIPQASPPPGRFENKDLGRIPITLETELDW
jgi:hypothetical protein